MEIEDLFLVVNTGRETIHFATRLAIQNLSNLKIPQWGLVRSIEDRELYEKLDSQFPHLNETKPNPASSMVRAGGESQETN